MTSRVSIPRRLDLSWDKTGHSQVDSVGGESIGREKRAEIERDLHTFALQLDSLDEGARILCGLDLLRGFDLAIDCLNRLLELGGSETASFEGRGQRAAIRENLSHADAPTNLFETK